MDKINVNLVFLDIKKLCKKFIPCLLYQQRIKFKNK